MSNIKRVDTGTTNASTGCGCFGCLGFIAFCFVVWALLFGITVNGVHHGIDCSTEHGVEIGAR